MTTGTGPLPLRHHRKHRHNLAPRERRDIEKAIQHSAAVRAKGRTAKAATLRKEENMRFLAVRPDLFDTPIPGLEGSTDEYTVSTSEELPSPGTEESILSSVPTLSRGLERREHGQLSARSMASPSPSSTTRSSSNRHYQRQHPGFVAGHFSPVPFHTPSTHSLKPSHHTYTLPSTSDHRQGHASAPHMRSTIASPNRMTTLSPLSRPLPPSPVDHDVDSGRCQSRGFSLFHDLPVGSGHLYQSSARDGDEQQQSPLTGRRRHDNTTKHDRVHPSRGEETTQTGVDRPHPPLVANENLARTLSVSLHPKDTVQSGQMKSPVDQHTTPQRRSSSPWPSPIVDINHEMDTAPVHAQEITRVGDMERQRHLDVNWADAMPQDNDDLAMEDGFPASRMGGFAHGSDPFRRLSALENQVDIQSKKLDSTNTKLDLLCDLIQNLKGSESSSGGGSTPTPRIPGRSVSMLVADPSEPSEPPGRAAPTLLVLGARSRPQANSPLPQAQNNVITQRRARAELRIERAIDAHWKTLMLTYRLPERAVVKGYKLENGKACSPTTFQPDHRETVKSPWNTSVVEVFVDSLLCSNHPHIPTPLSTEIRTTVFRLAFSQLRSWRAKQLLTAEEEKAKLQEKRRYERRRQSYFRRVNIASIHADTRHHLQMLSYLGPNGMSSDESDHEEANGIAQYRIKPKDWRHPDLARCVRVLDALHRKDRFQENENDNATEPSTSIRLTAGPGASTHLRVEGGSRSTRKPKRGLPDCLYNPELLKKPEGERLQAIPSVPYDFGHTASVLEMARPRNGDASRLGPFPEM